MTEGFKTGASTDSPLSEDDREESNQEDLSDAGEQENRGVVSDREMPGHTKSEKEMSGAESENSSPTSLPWIYARNSITDGRDKTVQLHLQSSTVRKQAAVRTELEEELDETVNLADLREAALLTGLRNEKEIKSILREWGYGIE